MTSNSGPPQGFIDLATAYTSPDNTFVDVIGVVVDIMPPTQARSGGDHTMTFKLLDRQLFNWVGGSQGMTIRFFRSDPASLPKVKKVGDVVLLRGVKLNSFTGQRTAISNFYTECTVFPADGIPNPNFAIAYQGKDRIEALGIPRDVSKLTMLEQSYVVRLKQDMSGIVGQKSVDHEHQVQRQQQRHEVEPPAKKQKFDGPFGAKYKLISALDRDRMFADLCGVVVKAFKSPYGCDLSITDYTSNNLLRLHSAPESESSGERDGDAFGYSNDASKKQWPGPYGQMTMTINVKPPHAQIANQTFKEGDIVLLQNVKTRITGEGPFLEGDLWPDHSDPDKVKLKKLEHHESYAEVKAILKRKDIYWKARQSMLAQKQSAEEKNNKASSKKAKKKAKKQKAKLDTEDGQVTMSGEGEDSETVRPTARPDRNQHIRCSNEEVHLTRVRDILDPGDVRHTNTLPDGQTYILPFINAKYRAKVRVVDFEPKLLEEFAVQPLLEDEDSLNSMAWQYDNTPKYEWHFSLLLEDATKGSMNSKEHNRLWVHIHHEQAQFLFGNNMDDPEDLPLRPRQTAQLREKMFLLWGNLEESSGGGDGQNLSNLPFECCIQEYGIELDEDDSAREEVPLGWRRMYSMFGVTIL